MKTLRADYDQAEGQEAALALEKYRRYPKEENEICPTRLGNGIRAAERYAFVHYRLDSQALWYELEAVAPAQVANNISNSKANIDFCVGSLYLSGFLGLSCVFAALLPTSLISSGTPKPVAGLLIAGCFFLVSIPLWYQFAVAATEDWAYSVQALVNVGRKPLAHSMGLALPNAIADEQLMWERVNWFVRGQLEERQESWLDAYRAVDDEGNGHSADRGLKRKRRDGWRYPLVGRD